MPERKTQKEVEQREDSETELASVPKVVASVEVDEVDFEKKLEESLRDL